MNGNSSSRSTSFITDSELGAVQLGLSREDLTNGGGGINGTIERELTPWFPEENNNEYETLDGSDVR